MGYFLVNHLVRLPVSYIFRLFTRAYMRRGINVWAHNLTWPWIEKTRRCCLHLLDRLHASSTPVFIYHVRPPTADLGKSV